ncbi:MAG: toll/interleukin-1 receptor domain-containing protein [Metamycoplasmataceae bacterium]
MKNIFFSYSAADEEFVDEVYRILEKEWNGKYNIFKFNSHKYDNAQSWAEIDYHMNKTDIYFVFISKLSIQSKAVRAELYAAFHKSVNDEKFILRPIILDNYTNWENEFKSEAFPIINSIHRIEEFNRDATTLAKCIIENIEKNQCPNYVPNFAANAILMPIKNKDKILKYCLMMKTNFDLSKVEFLYRTKNNYLKERSKPIDEEAVGNKFKHLVKVNDINYNFLTLIHNESIYKNSLFYLSFEIGKHFDVSGNDEIIEIILMLSINKSIKIDFIKTYTIDREEISGEFLEKLWNSHFES